MNSLIQTLLVILALVLAIGFLMKKFVWKKKSKKSCGTDDCGCH